MNATNTPTSVPAYGSPQYNRQLGDLYATNYFGVASFVILLYDHALTFDDEVRYIWRGRQKPVTWLFFINRYLTPLGFAINIHAYTSPLWTPVMFVKVTECRDNVKLFITYFFRCQHFVRYEGAMTLIGLSVSSLIMGFRVTAIYYGNRVVLALISFLFLLMVSVNAVLLTTGEPVHHPTGIHGCSMIFSPKTGKWASASAWLPLLYDTVVVVLIILRTRDLVHAKIEGQTHVVKTLVQDGLLYYSVILVAGLVLAIMIAGSADGLKNICAQFQLLITVTMMSRITLNLRKNMQRSDSETDSTVSQPVRFSYSAKHATVPRTSTQSTARSPWRDRHMQLNDEDLEGSVVDIASPRRDGHEFERAKSMIGWRDEH